MLSWILEHAVRTSPVQGKLLSYDNAVVIVQFYVLLMLCAVTTTLTYLSVPTSKMRPVLSRFAAPLLITAELSARARLIPLVKLWAALMCLLTLLRSPFLHGMTVLCRRHLSFAKQKNRGVILCELV